MRCARHAHASKQATQRTIWLSRLGRTGPYLAGAGAGAAFSGAVGTGAVLGWAEGADAGAGAAADSVGSSGGVGVFSDMAGRVGWKRVQVLRSGSLQCVMM